MTGSLKERALQAVLQAQRMLRTGQIDYALAIKTLYVAERSKLPFEEALKFTGWNSETEVILGELAELLLEAEVVTEHQLKAAKARSQNMGLPLGRTLVLMGLVSPSVMAAALNAQVLLKNQEINMQEAISGVKIACVRRISLENALTLEGIYQPKSESWLKLGELFAIAGLLSESDGLWAIEASLTHGRLLGDVLVEFGFVSSQDRDNALELQKMLAEGQINVQQATELLKDMNAYSISAAQALRQLTHIGSQVANLLKMAGLVSYEDLLKVETNSTQPVIDL